MPKALLLAACFLFAAPPLAGAQDSTTPPWQEAMNAAGPLLDAAKKATPSTTTPEGKAASAGVLSAYALLKPKQKEGLKEDGFRGMWNLLITLGHFHGLKAVPTEYQLDKGAVPSQPVRYALPAGRGWDARNPAEKSDQLWKEITKTLPNGRVVRHIKVWVYNWMTVYSGIPGENEKGLAEEGLKADRSTAVKITFRSNEVVKGRLGRGMPKAYFYEVSGVDKELGPVRRRNFYVKGTSKTFCIEVIELRKLGIDDDAWTQYQTAGEQDYELDAVLDSFEDLGSKDR
jgi:hypothetical protein